MQAEKNSNVTSKYLLFSNP